MALNNEEMLRKIVTEHLMVETEKVTADSLLDEDLGADSLDLVELQMAIEDEMQILVPDDDMEKIRTFGDLMKAVEKAPG